MDLPRIGIDILPPRARTWRQRLRLWLCGGEPAARAGWLRRLFCRPGRVERARREYQRQIQDALLRNFAASLGMSYQDVARDITQAHYSTLREYLLAAWRKPPRRHKRPSARGAVRSPTGSLIYCDPRLPHRKA